MFCCGGEHGSCASDVRRITMRRRIVKVGFRFLDLTLTIYFSIVQCYSSLHSLPFSDLSTLLVLLETHIVS
ncbi:hypothetical protein Bca4012_091754 [Brassica carinata]